MTGGVAYNHMMPYDLERRWNTQAAHMSALVKDLSSASTVGLPASARGAAQAFLDSWETIALKAETTSEVYADELKATGTSYENLDAEIARRMDSLGSGAR